MTECTQIINDTCIQKLGLIDHVQNIAHYLDPQNYLIGLLLIACFIGALIFIFKLMGKVR